LQISATLAKTKCSDCHIAFFQDYETKACIASSALITNYFFHLRNYIVGFFMLLMFMFSSHNSYQEVVMLSHENCRECKGRPKLQQNSS